MSELNKPNQRMYSSESCQYASVLQVTVIILEALHA
jgi:hypothetical protein